MKNAVKTFTSTFGVIMALAGIEHGVGEVLQGNIVPEGIMIQSWPNSAFFNSVNGEPAMTVVPNMLISGILAVLVSLALLIWSLWFVQKKHGALVMALISFALLLAGGGIFPPILAMLAAAVGGQINSSLTWWRTRVPENFRRGLAKLWPWFFYAGILSLLALMPGMEIMDYLFIRSDSSLVLILIVCMFGCMSAAIISAIAKDSLTENH